MTAPAISVLVPCFNQGQWIDEAIESVLRQTIQDFEIIVVDDGSTDPATAEKLASYDRPRTRVVRTGNRGLAAARNRAARLARGRFYCALDADDRLAPSWFEKALDAFERDPGLAFVSHWLEAFGDEAWVWQPEACGLFDLLTRNVVNSAALVRRELFEAIGGFDESMRCGCEDWEFWLRAVEAGYRGHIVPEVLYFYRRTPMSMSRQMLAGRGYATAMRQLFDRHAVTFSTHAVDLLVAKELPMLSVALEIHKLERDRVLHTKPRLERLREELSALDTPREPPSPEQLAATAERLQMATRELQAAGERETALQHAVETLQGEVRALRSSWSWKVTAPIRFIGGMFVR